MFKIRKIEKFLIYFFEKFSNFKPIYINLNSTKNNTNNKEISKLCNSPTQAIP